MDCFGGCSDGNGFFAEQGLSEKVRSNACGRISFQLFFVNFENADILGNKRLFDRDNLLFGNNGGNDGVCLFQLHTVGATNFKSQSGRCIYSVSYARRYVCALYLGSNRAA